MALTFMKSQNEGLVVEVKALREELTKSLNKTLNLETDLKSAKDDIKALNDRYIHL